MITLSETGLTSSEYAVLSSQLEAAKYRVTAHLWSPDFGNAAFHTDSNVTNAAGIDFDAVALNGHLVRVTHPGLVECYDGTTWTHTVIPNQPSDLLPPLSLWAESGVVYLYQMGRSHIYVTTSSDYGQTWSAWQSCLNMANINTDEWRNSLTLCAIGVGRVLWSEIDPATRTHTIRLSLPNAFPSMTMIETGLHLSTAIRSLTGRHMPTADDADRALIILSTDVPGRTSARYIDNKVVKYIFRSGGILGFWYQDHILSDHFPIDLLDQQTNWRFRECVRLSTIGDTMFLVAATGDGSLEHPFVKYRLYSSKDGRFWTNGFVISDIAANSHSTLKLLLSGNYLYAVSRRHTFRSPATLQFGVSSISLDITDRIQSFQMTLGSVSQASLLLANEDELLTQDLYTNPKHTWALIYEWGFDTPSGAVLQQVSIHEVDTWDPEHIVNDNSYESVVKVTSRDHLAWMQDRFESEQAHYWQNQIVGSDSFTDKTGTSYGGMQHTSPLSGGFKTDQETLLLTADNDEGVAFSTFSEDSFWNGNQQIGFRLAKNNDNEYAGIVFRASDKDNLLWFGYRQADDKLHLYERRAGVDTELASTGPMGWTNLIVNNYRFLRVDFRYATITCWYSTDGISWTLALTHIQRGAERIASDAVMVETRPQERGFVGVIGKGYSSLADWEPEVPFIDVGEMFDDNGFPPDPDFGEDLIEDSYEPLGLYSLTPDGKVFFATHDANYSNWSEDDISPTYAQRSEMGYAYKLVNDIHDPKRAYLFAQNGIYENPDLTARPAVWNKVFALPASSGRTMWSDAICSPVAKGTFFWLVFEFAGVDNINYAYYTGSFHNMYVYYTNDYFASVKVSQPICTCFIGQQSLAASYYHKNNIWVSTGRTPYNSPQGGIYRSVDGGKTWKRIHGPSVTIDDTTMSGSSGPIQGIWPSVVCPRMLPGGIKNRDDKLVITAYAIMNLSTQRVRVIVWWFNNWLLDADNFYNMVTATQKVFSCTTIIDNITGNNVIWCLNAAYTNSTAYPTSCHTYISTDGSFPFPGTSSNHYVISIHNNVLMPVGWRSHPKWLALYGFYTSDPFYPRSDSIRIYPDDTDNSTYHDAPASIFAINAASVFPNPLEEQTFEAQQHDWDQYDNNYDDTFNDGWVDDAGNDLIPYPPEVCITFIRNYVNDMAGPRTVEDAFRTYGTFAGILNYQFKRTVDGATSSTSDWASVAGTITKSGASIIYTPTGAGYSGIVYTHQEVPHNYVIRAYMPQTHGRGFILNAREPDATAFSKCHYWAGFDANGYPHLMKYNHNTNTYVLLQKHPVAVPTSGNVTVSVREMAFTTDKDSLWLVVSIWVNDRLFFTFSEWIKDPPETAYYIGIGTMVNAFVEAKNLVVPQLTELVEWNSLDPEETPMAGLSRAMEGRYTRFFVRYDGRLYAWYPTAATPVYSYTDSELEQYAPSFDRRQLVTHARMLGAYKEAEFIRTDLGPHRFKSFNNPYLMSERDCYREAIRSIQRQEEVYHTVEFTAPYRPLLEMGDVVTVKGENFIINDINLNLTPTEGTASIKARAYIYGA
jgi:hypothetical protein